MDDGTIPCVVTLKGPSVIEGLKELVELGVADMPLPPFLANLHSNAQTSLIVGVDDEATVSESNAKSARRVGGADGDGRVAASRVPSASASARKSSKNKVSGK